MTEGLTLQIPGARHKAEYEKLMDRWEATGEKIAPQLLGRYSGRLGKNVPYETWLEWCEDDRTTGFPCTLFFLVNGDGEVLGGMAINHGDTVRGHLHAGIAPWNRGKGYGTAMLRLALEKCREMGFAYVHIVPYKGNDGAVQTILKNGVTLVEEFPDDGEPSLRYRIDL